MYIDRLTLCKMYKWCIMARYIVVLQSIHLILLVGIAGLMWNVFSVATIMTFNALVTLSARLFSLSHPWFECMKTQCDFKSNSHLCPAWIGRGYVDSTVEQHKILITIVKSISRKSPTVLNYPWYFYILLQFFWTTAIWPWYARTSGLDIHVGCFHQHIYQMVLEYK